MTKALKYKDGHRKKANLWTAANDFCFKRNCNCYGCPNSTLMESTPCQIKKGIKEYIMENGLPDHLLDMGVLIK